MLSHRCWTIATLTLFNDD